MVSIKHQWLLEYRDLLDEIALIKWKIRVSESELERWLDPKDLGKYRLTNESKSAHLEENIKRLKAYLNEKELAKESFEIMVSRFNGLDNQILRMKYMEGMTLDAIAEELNYSTSHIYKRHAELVRTIKLIETFN